MTTSLPQFTCITGECFVQLIAQQFVSAEQCIGVVDEPISTEENMFGPAQTIKKQTIKHARNY